jgi:hypothetical protein
VSICKFAEVDPVLREVGKPIWSEFRQAFGKTPYCFRIPLPKVASECFGLGRALGIVTSDSTDRSIDPFIALWSA